MDVTWIIDDNLLTFFRFFYRNLRESLLQLFFFIAGWYGGPDFLRSRVESNNSFFFLFFWGRNRRQHVTGFVCLSIGKYLNRYIIRFNTLLSPQTTRLKLCEYNRTHRIIVHRKSMTVQTCSFLVFHPQKKNKIFWVKNIDFTH